MKKGGSYIVNGKTHYQRNKEYYKEKNKNLRKRNKEFVDNIKKQSKCMDCGISDYRVLDFDHLPEFEKDESISTGAKNRWSFERLLEEIGKCELVCSNCHRIRTLERNNK